MTFQFVIIVLSEIWCYNLKFYANVFNGYSFYYDMPAGVTVGGVGVYVSNSLLHSQIHDLKFGNSANLKVESIWLEIA